MDILDPTEARSPNSPAAGAARGGPPERRPGAIATGLLTVVLIVYLLREFSGILQQLAFAAFLAYLIIPVRRWLVRRRLPPFVAGVVVVAGVLAGSYGLGRAVYDGLDDLIAKLPDDQHHVTSMVEKVARSLVDRRSKAGAPEGFEQAIAEKAEALKQFVVAERWDVEHGLRVVRSALGSFPGYLGQLTIVVFYLGFLLAEQAGFPGRVEVAYGPRRGPPITAAAYRFNVAISRYVVVKTFVGLLVGTATTLVLLLFDVEGAVFWGVVAFVAHFVPYLGGPIGAALPALMCLIQFENPLRAALLLLQLAVVQVIGFLLEPRLAGRSLGLSPLAVLLALALGGAIWGVVGVIVAVPIAMVVKTILENIPETRPLATILSNL